MNGSLSAAITLLAASFGLLYLLKEFPEGGKWLQGTKVLIIGVALLSLMTATYAASTFMAAGTIAQGAMEWLFAAMVVVCLFIFFVAGISWVVGIFQSMLKQEEAKKNW
jgi:hypothetical protein